MKTRTDSNNGRNYVIHSPGRYVVENGEGCRRVSEAQIPDCLRPMRPNDRFVELFFETNRLWRNCFVTYSVNGDHHNEWRKIPMEMVCQSGIWFQRICATKGVTCAFNDGATDWDNNSEHNYHICLPGKYSIGGDHLVYQDPSDVDMHIN